MILEFIYKFIGIAKILILALSVVIVLSIVYRLLPARRLPNKKPLISLFPKYVFDVEDIEEFEKNLEKQNFKIHDNLHYYRGSYFGDFSAQWAKLCIKLDRENKQAEIASPLSVILFDTGDLWQISKELLC